MKVFNGGVSLGNNVLVEVNQDAQVTSDGNLVRFTRDTIAEDVDQFLLEKKIRNTGTYKDYKGDIEHFFLFVFKKEYYHVTVGELNEQLNLKGLRTVFNQLCELQKENGGKLYANNTINRKQASIKELLVHLKGEGKYLEDLDLITKKIKNLPKDTIPIESLSLSRAMEYSEWILNNEKHKTQEKYMACLLAIDTGCRAAEILELKWSDFTKDDGFIFVTGIGKGNKRWTEKISGDFYEEIKAALEIEGVDKLFTIKYTDVARMMNRAKKALGDENKSISFHSFKKCAVTSSYRINGSVKEAQRKGKHSSSKTTMDVYVADEDYGITGMISLAGGLDENLYKNADKETLLKAIESMSKDFRFMLNYRISELNKQDK